MRIIAVITLLILIGSVTCWADDHGNSPLAASPIEADGVLITACIEDAGDMDYFLFHATAGRTYRIGTSHPTAEMDSILYLIKPDGQGILAVDDNSGGESNARIVWTCTESGIYFLMVRHAQATTGTGCYGLSASIAQLDDHGNDRFSASPLSSGVTAAGFLEEQGDVDVFMIQVDQGYEYSIRFSSPGEESSLSALVFGNGSTVPLASLLSHGATQIETIAAAASEPLFLFIQSDSGEPTGSYILTIEKGGYADDHANSAASATPIPVEWTDILGNLEVPGDVDWFQLNARQEAEYTFALTSTGGSGGVKVAIRGPDGQLLQESATTVSGESIELSWQAPETGTYYLEISSTNGGGIYQLSVSSTLQLEAIATYNPSGYSLDIEVVNDMAYLIVGTQGLLILDVSDP
ncbi:PPC domain-containing protein, partial [Candidatus Bipolaricaulota bacterium]|nr:PPC domain-containing protein [Candidatus Bipolaricaulota bacterium]